MNIQMPWGSAFGEFIQKRMRRAKHTADMVLPGQLSQFD
jgi:hypothetical protein